MDQSNQTQTKAPATPPKAQASATLKVIEEGSNKKLLSLIPQGQSPKLYLDLIKAQVMGVDKRGNARSDNDLLMFLYVCKRTGLDPLTRQIYAVFRWSTNAGKEVMSIQTGIDGMRLTAQRSKEYAGQEDIVFTPEDETTKYPTKAKCTVYRMVTGQRVAFSATARWSEYVQTDRDGVPTGMWIKMPYTMLGKCAEALALRKAFPNELSGLYTAEEMSQSTNVIADLPKPEAIKVQHGAPQDMPKDIAIGSPEAATVAKVEAPQISTDEVAKQLAEMRARMKKAQESNPLPITEQK